MDKANKPPMKESLHKFFKSDSFKAIAVLCLFALLSALILSVVHRYTLVDEEEAMRNKIRELYTAAPVASSLDVKDYNNIENSEIISAFYAEDGACIIVSKSKKAYNAGTGITLIVVIKEGEIVFVSDYASSETPGLGTRALQENYLSQYVGLEAEELAVRDQVEIRDPSDQSSSVQFISGATKSSTGVKLSVTAAATFYMREVA